MRGASFDLLDDHWEWLRRIARAMIRDENDADDAIQDVAMLALRYRPDPTRPLRPWLVTVLRNVIRSRKRSANRRQTRELASTRHERTEDATRRIDLLHAVTHELREMPEQYRAVLDACVLRDLKPSEYAEEVGLNASTVRTRLNRALKQLRQRLDDECDGDRKAWIAALTPFALPYAPGAASVPTIAAAAALVGLLSAVAFLLSDRAPAPLARGPVAVASAPPEVGSASNATPIVAPPQRDEPSRAATYTVSATVVGADGNYVPDAKVHAERIAGGAGVFTSSVTDALGRISIDLSELDSPYRSQLIDERVAATNARDLAIIVEAPDHAPCFLLPAPGDLQRTASGIDFGVVRLAAGLLPTGHCRAPRGRVVEQGELYAILSIQQRTLSRVHLAWRLGSIHSDGTLDPAEPLPVPESLEPLQDIHLLAVSEHGYKHWSWRSTASRPVDLTFDSAEVELLTRNLDDATPVPGAEVWILPGSLGLSPWCLPSVLEQSDVFRGHLRFTTDEDGGAVVRGLDAGVQRYHLQATASGYAMVVRMILGTNLGDRLEVDMRPGEVTFGGVVLDDEGRPVANATVVSKPREDLYPVGETTTDPRGRFTLTWPGDARTTIVHAEFDGQMSQWLELRPPTTDQGQDLTLQLTQWTKSTMRFVDQDGNPMPELRPRLCVDVGYGWLVARASGPSDEDGVVEFEAPIGTRWDCRLSTPDDLYPPSDLSIVTGVENIITVVRDPPTRSITIRPLDRRGQPVSADVEALCKLHWRPHSDGSAARGGPASKNISATPTGDGGYSLADVPPSVLTVFLKLEDESTQCRTFLVDEQSRELVIDVDARAALSIRVERADGVAAAAGVTLHPSSALDRTRRPPFYVPPVARETDDGWCFDDVVPGEYVLRYRSEDGLVAEKTVLVHDNVDQEVVLEPRPGQP